jgi:hypothetical protein
MTRYRVEWDPAVDAHFINAWIAADSALRHQLTEIGNWVDRELAVDPDTKGEYQSDFEVRTLAVRRRARPEYPSPIVFSPRTALSASYS